MSVHFTVDQTEYEETKKKAKTEITLRKRQIAVIEDVLRRSLCGDLVDRIILQYRLRYEQHVPVIAACPLPLPLPHL